MQTCIDLEVPDHDADSLPPFFFVSVNKTTIININDDRHHGRERQERGLEAHRGRDANEDQAEEESDELHVRAAERAGAAVRRDPLPGRLHARGAEPEAGTVRGPSAGRAQV